MEFALTVICFLEVLPGDTQFFHWSFCFSWHRLPPIHCRRKVSSHHVRSTELEREQSSVNTQRLQGGNQRIHSPSQASTEMLGGLRRPRQRWPGRRRVHRRQMAWLKKAKSLAQTSWELVAGQCKKQDALNWMDLWSRLMFLLAVRARNGTSLSRDMSTSWYHMPETYHRK